MRGERLIRRVQEVACVGISNILAVTIGTAVYDANQSLCAAVRLLGITPQDLYRVVATTGRVLCRHHADTKQRHRAGSVGRFGHVAHVA
jgi:hypothetical protein